LLTASGSLRRRLPSSLPELEQDEAEPTAALASSATHPTLPQTVRRRWIDMEATRFQG
jgi:hypothetical protein